jgi:hypothetical protein
MARALTGTIRFLYRLALFPWLTVQVLAYTMASQVNWLMTGMTFDQVDKLHKRSSREMLEQAMRRRD